MATSTPSQMSDCPICLNGMEEPDKTYPLLCPTECGYNFCTNCVQHLVASSNCDYEEASDGNRHVKIQLQCPQCRGDLSNTIHDTLLLRKALVASRYIDIPDSELNATELRIKHDFGTKYGEAVRDAEARMQKFHNGGGATESLKISMSKEKEEKEIDVTLFGGLEYAMTDDEQAFVTQLMTSGDKDNLAQASQILHGITQISLQGVTPSMRGAASNQASSTSRTNTSRAGARSRYQQKVENQAELKRIEDMEKEKKLHPLPSRMPRFALLTAFDTSAANKTIKFENDEWDGGIEDAFMRMHKRTQKRSPGVDHVLALADDARISEPRGRVMIAAVRGEAGRLGLQRGDIVTHINSEPFEGDAEQLNELILSIYNENPGDSMQFAFVVNAEACCAEALKLRARACKESSDL